MSDAPRFRLPANHGAVHADSLIRRGSMTRRDARPRPGSVGGRVRVPRLDWRRFRLTWLALPGSALAALVVGAGMLLALGANPVTGYRALLDGAFGDSYALSATAVKAVPLLLVGVGICIAFRANVFNIGGEGQIAMGALLRDGDRARASGSPGGPPDPAHDPRRCGGRRALGRDTRRLQGLLRGQRDPEHDHAQSRRRPGDELHAGGAAA